MSSEVCPFCGKTYKRLNSHLPHCKAAASSKTPPTKQDVAADQTASSSQLAAAKTTEKGKKSVRATTGLQTKKGKKASASSSEPLQSSTPAETSSSSSLSSASPPPSAKKKKKQKLADQIKTSSLFPSPSPTISQPKKKSVRALIDAAKSNQVTKGSLEGTRSASEDLTLPVGKSSTRPPSRETLWVDREGEVEDLSENTLFSKSGSGHQGRITLQDVKATLGRANAPRQSKRPFILSQIEATDNPNSKIRLDTGLSLPLQNQKHAVICSVPPTLPESQHTELQSVKKKASKSKQAALIPLQDDASHQPTSIATPLLSALVSSQMMQATPPPHTGSLSEGLKVGRHETGLLALSSPLTEFSSPLRFPLAPQTLPVKVDSLEKLQLKVRRRNTAENPTEGALTQRRLGQVRLRELPEWLANKTPGHPRDAVEMVQRGWQWYYRKYIDVKKGGVAGVGMLLVGYCVLSYIWRYPDIKLDRWRKYH